MTITTVKPPAWKLAFWAKDSIEPAMLRVPVVIIVFLVLWGFNMWILDKLRIPYHYALPMKSANFSFLFSTVIILLSSYSIIVTLISNSLRLNIEYSIFAFHLFVFIIHWIPLPVLSAPERGGFYRILRMIFFPGSTIAFSEVLLADALTSLSKVFKDWGISIVAMYAEIMGLDILALHDHSMILIALLASLPFWLRVRQCWVQLDSCPDYIAKIPVTLNIIKYCTAFPAIWLTAAASLGYSNPALPHYIKYAATINSLYSFGWDLIMDWGLITIHRDWRVIRRQRALLPWYSYLIAAVINFCLRFLWAVNHIPGMNHVHSSVIVLVIEIGEVCRRSMWNIFRIEWEVIVQQDKSVERESDSVVKGIL